MIILSCGHQDFNHESGWPLFSKGVSKENYPCIEYKHVCGQCLSKDLLEYPDCIFVNHKEAEEWLHEQYN